MILYHSNISCLTAQRLRPAAPSAHDSIISGPPSVVTETVDGSEGGDSDDSDKTIELLRPNPTGRSSAKDTFVLEELLSAFTDSKMRPRRRNEPSHMSSARMSSVTSDDLSSNIHDELESLLEGITGLMSTKGGNPNRTRKGGDLGQGWSVLHSAASNGKIMQIKALIARGADVDAREVDEWTPIMLAAQNGHADAVRELLDNGAKVNATSAKGVTALRQAAQNGHFEVIEVLLSYGANPNIEVAGAGGPLMAAVYNAAKGRLLKSETNPETTTKIVRALVMAKANVNSVDSDGDTALHICTLHGDAEWARILINAKADVNGRNDKGRTPLSNAAYEANVEMVRMLLANGAKPDISEETQWTPLHFAAQFLHKTTFETIRLLVEGGADVNSRINDNATALHIAAQKGDVDILQYLIDKKAIVDAQTASGRTPLFQAVSNGHAEAVNLLARAGANVNIMEAKGLKMRPLHVAVIKGEKRIVENLLDLGADIEAVSGLGNQTPLRLASNVDERDDIFMLLLDRGARAT